MKKLLAFAFFLAVISLACSTAKVAEQTNSNGTAEAAQVPAATSSPAAEPVTGFAPDLVVTHLYKQHGTNKDPFFQSKDRSLVDKYFTRTLADLIWKDATRKNQNEVGALDGDPLYNAQDVEIKNLAFGAAEVKGDKAQVAVTFENFGKKQKLKYSLLMEKGNWKIDDIDYGEGQTLVKWLKEGLAAEDDAAAGDARFEGKYQVGDTTCTVKPVKMAFEVKWAKGSGTEIFVYDDRSGDRVVYKSESSKKGAEPNMFSFDDATLDTGTFYRSDGKEFPIKRVK